MSPPVGPDGGKGTRALFPTTVWQEILTARDGDSTDVQAGLERLCQVYWYPVYAFLRRHGRSPDDAKELTQGFFAKLLTRFWLRKVEPEKGKFRTFLLACLKNFLRDERDRENAWKRNYGLPAISIDVLDAEGRYSQEPIDERDPSKIFERRWALIQIDNVLKQLKEEFAEEGKAVWFDALCPFLNGDAERGDLSGLAKRLGTTDGAVRTAVTRLRGKFRLLLRAEIGRTVSSAAELEGEIGYLFALFER